MLRLLDAWVARAGLPLETVPVDSIPAPLPRREYAAFVLNTQVSAHPWLRELGAPTVLAAPFVARGGERASTLVWPFEDVLRMRTGVGAETWETSVETASLSRVAVEAAVRAGVAIAREREAGPPIWAYAGWGETEEAALAVARATLEELRVLPLEQCLRGELPPVARGEVILGLGRTALPLARCLEAEGWVSWSAGGTLLAAASSPRGAALAASLLLDRLGFVDEAAELERITREELAAGLGPDLVDRVVERIARKAGVTA
jgi:hypothetical protein